MEKLLTPIQVADMLQKNPYTIKSWLKNGKLKGIQIGGRSEWRIRESDLKVFLGQDDEQRFINIRYTIKAVTGEDVIEESVDLINKKSGLIERFFKTKNQEFVSCGNSIYEVKERIPIKDILDG